jgi:hypothetical protein
MRRVAPAAAIATSILAAVFLLAGCGASPATPDATSSGPARVEGIVIDIVASGPVEVSRFTLRTADGTAMDFDVGPLEVGDGAFPADHLGEHRLTAEPVAVVYRDDGGRRVAIRLEDAGPAPSPS